MQFFQSGMLLASVISTPAHTVFARESNLRRNLLASVFREDKPGNPDMALTERRDHPRWQARGIKAWVSVGHGKPESCRIVDVSRKGVLIRSPLSMAAGMTIELAFARTQGSNVTRLFRCWAQVARSAPNTLAMFFVKSPSDADQSARSI